MGWDPPWNPPFYDPSCACCRGDVIGVAQRDGLAKGVAVSEVYPSAVRCGVQEYTVQWCWLREQWLEQGVCTWLQCRVKWNDLEILCNLPLHKAKL